MKRPNILVFMTDHQRGDTVPPYKRALTPNLDAFYNQAVSFTNSYCTAPHCCPSRASFFTGLYPSEHGVWNNVDVGNTLSRGLFDGVRLWSEDLKEAGYNLFFSGKWHVSSFESPGNRGFKVCFDTHGSYDRSFGNFPATNEWEKYYINKVMCDDSERKDGEIKRKGYPTYFQYGLNENPFRDTTTVEKAISALTGIPCNNDGDDDPWCIYVGTLGPHDPYLVPQRFLDMYNMNDIELPENFYDDLMDKPALYRRTKDRYSQLTSAEHRKSILHFLAFCTYEDYLFGQLLDALKKHGDYDNTTIIYLSDHGDYMGEHGLWAKGLPCFKAAYHIPLLIKCPDMTEKPGRIVNAPVSIVDLAPTIMEIAGVKTDRRISGASLVPFLLNVLPDNWRKEIYTQSNGNELYGIQRSVMTNEWKYVYNGFDYDELYNLKDDPNELRNLLAGGNEEKYDDILKELCGKLWRFAYEHSDVCINPYIMVAHAPYGPGLINL